MLWLLAQSPALRVGEQVVQGSARSWSVHGAATRQQLRGQNHAEVALGAARISEGMLPPYAATGTSEEATVQGDVLAWSVHGAAARDELRAQNHGAARFSGAIQPTKPLFKAMTGTSEEAQVQGRCGHWSVRGAAAREQLRQELNGN